jgi:hypothetical protein
VGGDGAAILHFQEAGVCSRVIRSMYAGAAQLIRAVRVLLAVVDSLAEGDEIGGRAQRPAPATWRAMK